MRSFAFKVETAPEAWDGIGPNRLQAGLPTAATWRHPSFQARLHTVYFGCEELQAPLCSAASAWWKRMLHAMLTPAMTAAQARLLSIFRLPLCCITTLYCHAVWLHKFGPMSNPDLTKRGCQQWF